MLCVLLRHESTVVSSEQTALQALLMYAHVFEQAQLQSTASLCVLLHSDALPVIFFTFQECLFEHVCIKHSAAHVLPFISKLIVLVVVLVFFVHRYVLNFQARLLMFNRRPNEANRPFLGPVGFLA